MTELTHSVQTEIISRTDPRRAFDYLYEKDAERFVFLEGLEYFDPCSIISDEQAEHFGFYIGYEPDSLGRSREVVMVADFIDSEPVGWGEFAVYRGADGEIASGPQVAFTHTEEGQRRKGYGRSRLLAMNAMANQQYGKPLQSDVSMTDEAKSLWQGLVRDDIAEEWGYRFRFKKDSEEGQ